MFHGYNDCPFILSFAKFKGKGKDLAEEEVLRKWILSTLENGFGHGVMIKKVFKKVDPINVKYLPNFNLCICSWANCIFGLHNR